VRPAARLPLLLALLLAAAFAIAACGGESKEDFANDADAICKEADEKLDDVDRPSTNDEIPEFLNETLEIAEDTKADLEDLDPPDDVEDDWNSYLDNVDEGIELVEDARDAAEEGDSERASQILNGDEQQELEEENDQLAEDIGLEDCAES
jgi:hypothetical protein